MIVAMVVIAVILLLLHWKGPNAVWGSIPFGIVIGIIVSLIIGDWKWLATILSINIYIGTLVEWIWRLSKGRKRGDK